MKYIVLFIFVFSFQFVSSQETFFSFIEGWRNFKITEKNNNYISIGTSVSLIGYNRMQFIELSEVGDPIDASHYEIDSIQHTEVVYTNGILSNNSMSYLFGACNDADTLRGLFLKFNNLSSNPILKYYNLANEGTIIRIATLKDDTTLLLGVYNINNSIFYSSLIETDTSGNIRWQKDFTCTGNCLLSPFHILPTRDNGFIFTCVENYRGSHYGNNEYLKTAVIKTDSLGNTEWRHTWGGDSTKNKGSWVVPLDDGNFLFAWSDNSYSGELGNSNPNATIRFIKFDINGNEIWEKSMNNYLPIGRSYTIAQMELMPDGNIIIAGDDFIHGLLLKIDQETNYIWHRELMPPNLAYEDNTASYQYMKIKGVTFTSDDGFILAGEYFCSPDGNLIPDGMQSAFVYKLDEYGCYEQNCHIGVEETPQETKPAITIYPNPSTGILNLSFTSEGATQSRIFTKNISIFNAIGQLAYNTEIKLNTTKQQINLSHLPKGLYFIDIGGLTKTKFIIE